jgi:hypothetical protein
MGMYFRKGEGHPNDREDCSCLPTSHYPRGIPTAVGMMAA